MEFTTTIDAKPEQVWVHLRDFPNIYKWHSNVSKSYSTNKKKGLGEGRTCEFESGGQVDEIVSDWQEGKEYTVQLTNAKGVPIKSGSATFGVEERDGKTVAYLKTDVKPKGGIFAPLLKLVMDRLLKKGVSAALESLKETVEG